jgi:hypothetical protein
VASPVECELPETPSDDVAVERVKVPGGGCLPGDVALVYRCDPALDPVATLGAGSARRRFLGGRFAVPVDAVPVGSRSLGVTTLGRLWSLGADGLFMESGGTVERWLALPGRNEVGEPPSALMIGDSIMDGAEEAMPLALPDWTLQLDAEVGRGSFGGASIAEAFTEPVPDAVVIELGVNDHDGEVFAANAERMLAAFEEARVVIWVTAHGPDTDVDVINEAIRDVIGARTDAAIADWDSFVSPEDLNGDGVHPGAGNEGLLAELVAPMVDDWWMATRGLGPARCAPALESAT